MPLRIQGSVVVDAPREDVYRLLLDPELMKQVINKIPGVSVERLEQVSENEFNGTATIGVAMVKGTYDGKITILDRRPGEYVKLRGDGKGGGNWTSGEAELTLVQQDGRTVMNYLGQGNISGQLASVGPRLVDTVGRQIVDQGAQAFADEIAAQRRVEVGLPPIEKPAPAIQTLVSNLMTRVQNTWAQTTRNINIGPRARWAIPAAVGAVVLIGVAIYFGRSR